MRYLITTFRTFALCGLLLACAARVVSAADAPVDVGGAIEAARSAQSQFTPISDEKFSAARAALESSMVKMERWLSTGGARKADGWKEYLKWGLLETQLAEGEQASLKQLESVLAQFTGLQIVGLEMPRIVAVRAALRRYIDALYVKATPNIETRYKAQLDALIATLEKYSAEPSTDVAAIIGVGVEYLERTGQAPGVVKLIRNQFGQPNLLVRASREFLVAGLERDVDETAPIRDVILGTSISGSGRTTGRVTGRLVPNEEAATIEVQLTAVNRSHNVGYNGPVTIYSTGLTNISAGKRVQIDSTGLHGRPAWATCRTSSNIYDISARCRLLERVARRRANQQGGQAERIAASHAEQRVISRFDAEVRSALADVKEKYEERFRKPLLRKNQFPQMFELSSSEKELVLRALQADGSQLASPTAAPGIAPGVDLSVRMHESMAGNASEGIIGGLHLTDERLAEILEKQTGEVPEELRITQDKDPWSITFARRQPVSVVFGDDSLRIAIRGSEFTRGDTTLKQAMEISASYLLEQTPAGAKLTRQGDVEVMYLRSRGQLGIRQVTFKTFMRRKFSALFKEEFVGEGLELPGPMKERGKLPLAQLETGNGWIALGWNLPPQEQGAE